MPLAASPSLRVPASTKRVVRSAKAAAVAQPDQVTVYPHGLKVKVAPDQELQPWPDHVPLPSKIGVFEMRPQGDGSYKPFLRLQAKLVRMKATITEELGLGITYASLRRLMMAGFVRSEQVTPGQYAFDLQSYFQHCANVRSDPEFWSGENLKKYMEAI